MIGIITTLLSCNVQAALPIKNSDLTWQDYKKMVEGVVQAEVDSLPEQFRQDKSFTKTITWVLEPRCYSKGQQFYHGQEGKNFDCFEQIFNTLEITVPTYQIKEYYDKYKVILNRPPQHDTLVIGCGNLLPAKEGLLVYYIDNYGLSGEEYRVKHAHKNCDTIDPDYARNPTIVGAFGITDITGLFKGHKYKKIIIEGIAIESNPFTDLLLINLLTDDGDVKYYKRHFTEYSDKQPTASKATRNDVITSMVKRKIDDGKYNEVKNILYEMIEKSGNEDQFMGMNMGFTALEYLIQKGYVAQAQEAADYFMSSPSQDLYWQGKRLADAVKQHQVQTSTK